MACLPLSPRVLAELPVLFRLPQYENKGLSEFVNLPESLAGKLFFPEPA